MRGPILIAAAFAALAISLLGALPLWLDEILQLRETRDTTIAQLLTNVPRNSGAAPLGYLAQQASLRVTGYGLRRARIPALIFAIGSVFGIALLASEIGLARPWLAALIFAAFPMTLRYAVEARIYSQAAFLSILATILYLRLVKDADFGRAALYALALTCAVYTQAFTIFVGVALLIWSALVRDWRAFRSGAIALATAAIAFLPWYLYSRAEWATGIVHQGFQFSFTSHTPLMLFREIPGAGYWGSGLLLILCAIGTASTVLPSRTKSLLALLIFVSLLGGLAADAQAEYFIAARQFMWILPSVAILAAVALQVSRLTTPILAGLIVVCGLQSAKYFTAPHENWAAAADEAARYVDSNGVCIKTDPPDYVLILGFFHPELSNCTGPARAYPIRLR